MLSSAGFHSAQRRPGSKPRRHGPGEDGQRRREPRSTKAGVEAPATRGPPRRRARPYPPLNEGRGRSPGDTSTGWRGRSAGSAPLNEGRGRSPGDTMVREVLEGWAEDAQRRPGSKPRRHSRGGCATQPLPPTLNEGRGRSPGDTQQIGGGGVRPFDRSTKAGVEAPATPEISVRSSRSFPSAQRRPGSKPRRHGPRIQRGLQRRVRSTKAGVEAPATPGSPLPRRPSVPSLNEGRGRSPGDTANWEGHRSRTRSHARPAAASTAIHSSVRYAFGILLATDLRMRSKPASLHLFNPHDA